MGLRPASAHDLDFIAAARQDVPRLVTEIRQLRSLGDENGDGLVLVGSAEGTF